MIKQLSHQQLPIANLIYDAFQISYPVEAALIGVDDFPPLKRTIIDIQGSQTSFYGYWVEGNLAGVVEVLQDGSITDICSLVVVPAFFRQGIASSLLHFVIRLFPSEIVTVETGAANAPAIKLYRKVGFEEEKRWKMAIGIEKVKFRLKL